MLYMLNISFKLCVCVRVFWLPVHDSFATNILWVQ